MKGGGPHFPDHRKNERGIPKRRKIYQRIYYLDDDLSKVVLFTDQQMDDIVSFCCNDIDGH